MTGSSNMHAITMWDFSWLERRWPGAGYENWDRALDELAERGYNAVRIDAYPHLLAIDATREWELLPIWDQHDWGAPGPIKARVQPALTEFAAKCAERGIAVGLSSWFRPDTTGANVAIRSPQDLAAAWSAALGTLADAGLLGSVLYVDLCNEYPLKQWAPWLGRAAAESRHDPDVIGWMTDSLAALRKSYPTLPYCFSFCNELDNWQDQDVSMHDLLELHVWMSSAEVSNFHEAVSYNVRESTFDPRQWANMVANGERCYGNNPEYWTEQLQRSVADLAEWSRASGKPLVTTEAWAVINYKDWPDANWGWIKELCEAGVRAAVETRRWAAVCTSNFCGPQFRGMWEDVGWHQRLTAHIRNAESDVSLPLQENS